MAAPQSQHQAPIATGGYGCVYRPAITCEGVPPVAEAEGMAGSVAKLQTWARVAKNETKIGELVAGLPLADQYFVVPTATCVVPARVFPSALAQGCEPIGTDQPSEVSVMLMPDVPHHKLGTAPLRGTPSELRNMLRNLVVGLPHCLEALVLLQSGGEDGKNPIVHFDLKADNIFAPDPPRLPLVADFGISFLPLEQEYKDAARLTINTEPGYYVWPPEVHLLGYLMHGRDGASPETPATEEELAGLAKRIGASDPGLANDPEGVERRTQEVLEYYRSLAPVTGERVFGVVKEYWDKIDLYSLCTCFGTVMGAYELGDAEGYLAPVMAMLQEGRAVDPAERPALGRVLVTARKAVSGGSEATIRGLTTVRTKAEANHKRALVTLRGVDRTLGRLTVRLDRSLREGSVADSQSDS